MKFKTVSGSEYEIRYFIGAGGSKFIRRINESAEKRADGIWVKLVNDPVIEVGEQAYLVVESLRGYTGDDYGTPDEQADDVTVRTTSTVTEVWND